MVNNKSSNNFTKKYIRDGRAPIPLKENISRVMRSNKAKNTGPEVLLRKELCKQGLNKYRLNYNKVPGRPDIVFVSKKIAIFVNGCYWHRCPFCKLPLPKTNKDFWQAKFKRNKVRDKLKIQELNKLGWLSITIWECQIRKDINTQSRLIQRLFHDEKKFQANRH